MLARTMSVNPSLAEARRLPLWGATLPGVTVWELAILVSAGIASAVMSCAIDGWGIPGSAVLQGVLPMAAGLALVPRRGGGLVMGTSAFATGLLVVATSTGSVTPSTLARLWLLGACLDFALLRSNGSARVWFAFILAGLAANLLGFGVKLVAAQLGWEGVGGRGLFSSWPMRMTSYAICGALAGGVSALLFFRRPRSLRKTASRPHVESEA